jgi:hypothetical protein
MKYLAIGINHERGDSWSIGVDTNEMEIVVRQLTAHNGNGHPDEVLLVKNGNDGPEIDFHEYPERFRDEVEVNPLKREFDSSYPFTFDHAKLYAGQSVVVKVVDMGLTGSYIGTLTPVDMEKTKIGDELVMHNCIRALRTL